MKPELPGSKMGTFSMVAGMGFEPHDLRVMSPTSYRTALPRDILPGTLIEYHKRYLLSTPFCEKAFDCKMQYLSQDFSIKK